MEYADFMNSFVVRNDIFDDLTYLQKHLRLLVKIHQKLSSKLYISTAVTLSNGTKRAAVISKNFFVIRKFMDELEEEMEDLSSEQKVLTGILKTLVGQYLTMLWKDCKIKVENDVAYGYITRALQFHYQKNNFNIQPTNVKLRTPEDVLMVRYGQIHRQCISERANKGQKQESLLKPKFQKPSSSSSSAAGSSGRVDKKYPSKKSTVIEARHAKIIYQKQQTPVNGTRSNLLKALNKVKNDQNDGKAYAGDFDDNSSSSIMGKYNRSDEDCSDQSSYDEHNSKRHSPASNGSDNAINWHKLFPPLPIEPPPKTEYNQEEFLGLFKLITPKFAEELKNQRSKRKSRRNCVKNEKNDFHYGKFDLNEAAFRARMTNNKRSILYSPNNKRK